MIKEKKEDKGKRGEAILDALEKEELEKNADKKTNTKTKPEKKKTSATKKIKTRSQRYKDLRNKVDFKKEYSLEEAIELIKSSASAKFDETIETHISTILKKGDTPFREVIEMPGGLVKKPRVIELTDTKIEEIKKGKIDFDIALARPDMMAKVASVARILGSKGLMPNPKLGTVTDDPEAQQDKLENLLKEVKADSRGIIHAGVGKVSWESAKTIANLQAILAKVNRAKVVKIIISSTMGAGIKVNIKQKSK